MSREKIAVAMSGGVDSSVAAALLVREGYDVFGITMVTHEKFRPGGAEKVCRKLGTARYVLDLKTVFKREVVDYFCREYLKAKTPNPCIICNREIKFGRLLDFALAKGATCLATGHYAKLAWDKTKKRYLIRRAGDKDQSYMLWALSQEQLSKAIFPVSGLKKSEVRRLVKKLSLPVDSQADSQEICFISDNNYRRFLSEQKGLEISPGPIVNLAGEKLGEHKGLPFYTVGQRKGLNLSHRYPLYVTQLRLQDNTLVVGEEKALYKKHLLAEKVNFIAFENLVKRLKVKAMVRYKVEEAAAFISPVKKNQVQVDFLSPQRAIALGQSVVFYHKDLLVGGGVISSTW